MTADNLYLDVEEDDWSPSRKRVITAWLTHLVTASSAVWGLLAILAITNQEWTAAFWWMAIAILIDSFDGLLARRVDVKRVLPQIDGALLDNIVDYLNYVFVPAYFLYSADLLPPGFMVIIPAAILLASAYQFSQTEAKTDDHFFKGFPSYWNVVVFYMFLLELNPWVNLGFAVLFCILVFVPIKYIYPSRTTIQPRLTMILGVLWGICNFIMLLLYPDYPRWIMWFAIAYIIYYHVLSLYATWITRDRGVAG
jgi:phosphatidylcholine synthase